MIGTASALGQGTGNLRGSTSSYQRRLRTPSIHASGRLHASANQDLAELLSGLSAANQIVEGPVAGYPPSSGPHHLGDVEQGDVTFMLDSLPIYPVREAAAADQWALFASLVGSIEGPPDLAEEHDHYLYGVAKRSS